MARLREKRKAKGLCPRCCKIIENPKASCCNVCAEYNRLYNRRKRAEKHSAIRERKTWGITNDVLYTWMVVNKVSIKQLADKLSVSPRTVQRWLFEAGKPTEENRERLAEFKLRLEKQHG